jgi:hypothetical protein
LQYLQLLQALQDELPVHVADLEELQHFFSGKGEKSRRAGSSNKAIMRIQSPIYAKIY